MINTDNYNNILINYRISTKSVESRTNFLQTPSTILTKNKKYSKPVDPASTNESQPTQFYRETLSYAVISSNECANSLQTPVTTLKNLEFVRNLL